MSISVSGYLGQVTGMDLGNLMIEMQEVYVSMKNRMQEWKAQSQRDDNNKFSEAFESKYSELSVKFQSMIKRTRVGFEDHRNSLQQQEETIAILLVNKSLKQQTQLMDLLVRMLIKSQSIYEKWMQEQVQMLKQELENVILKNCQMEMEIRHSYEEGDMIKDRLEEEVNYRAQLQRHLMILQKEVMELKDENHELIASNKSIMKTKDQLAEKIQSSKHLRQPLQITNNTLLSPKLQKHVHLQQQNQYLRDHLAKLTAQLQQIRQQQQGFIEEIRHQEQIIDNQNYELEFYKSRDLKENSSAIQQSYEKLNKYEDLVLDNYYKTSEKGSLRSFMLSHQKSMGKLTIFEQNKEHQDRVYEKTSNPDMSLTSFEYAPQSGLKKHHKDESFIFSQFNQVTFRPQADPDSTKNNGEHKSQDSPIKSKDEKQEISNCLNELKIDSQEKQNNQDEQQAPDINSSNIYIEPLNLSGKKHYRQRSQSITEGNSGVSKKLIYETKQSKQLQPTNIEQQLSEQIPQSKPQVQLERKPQLSYSNSVSKFYPQKKKFIPTHSRKNVQISSQLKRTSFDNILYQQPYDPKNQWDNKSEHSVNKVLIKKNIKVQKQIDSLVQKLQVAQSHIQNLQQIINEKDSKLSFYKQQLSKSQENNIFIRSQLEICKSQLQIFQKLGSQNGNAFKQALKENQEKTKELNFLSEELHQLNQIVSQQEILLSEKQDQIINLKQQIQEIEQKLKLQKLSFQERLTKVKDYCKNYIQEKHRLQLCDLQAFYKKQISLLKQQLQKKVESESQEIQTMTKILKLQACLNHKIQSYKIKSQACIQTDFIPKCLSIQNLISQKLKFQDKIQNKSLQTFNILKCFSQNFIFQKPKQPKTQLSISRIYSEHFLNVRCKEEKQTNTQECKQVVTQQYQTHKPNIKFLTFDSEIYSLLISPSKFSKSPLFQNKRLLNTPSNVNTLDTRKDSQSSNGSKQPELRLISSQPSISQLLDDIQNQHQSFYTVSYLRESSSSESLSDVDSFFTCIHYSSESLPQSIPQNNHQDIFVVKKDQLLDKLDLLTQVQPSQGLDSVPSQDEKLSPTEPIQFFIPGSRSENIREFRQVQQDQIAIKPPSVKSSQKSSKYFNLIFENAKSNMQDQQHLSKVFQKRLSPYFKKHTTFTFSNHIFPSGYLPQIQKMYMIHTRVVPISGKQLPVPNEKKSQRFLLYKKILLHIESQRKLQVARSQIFKFIQDSDKMIYGNFQIQITEEEELKITRKNKRCYYLGNIEDAVWPILKIQEITIS